MKARNNSCSAGVPAGVMQNSRLEAGATQARSRAREWATRGRLT